MKWIRQASYLFQMVVCLASKRKRNIFLFRWIKFDLSLSLWSCEHGCVFSFLGIGGLSILENCPSNCQHLLFIKCMDGFCHLILGSNWAKLFMIYLFKFEFRLCTFSSWSDFASTASQAYWVCSYVFKILVPLLFSPFLGFSLMFPWPDAQLKIILLHKLRASFMFCFFLLLSVQSEVWSPFVLLSGRYFSYPMAGSQRRTNVHGLRLLLRGRTRQFFRLMKFL